ERCSEKSSRSPRWFRRAVGKVVIAFMDEPHCAFGNRDFSAPWRARAEMMLHWQAPGASRSEERIARAGDDWSAKNSVALDWALPIVADLHVRRVTHSALILVDSSRTTSGAAHNGIQG